MEKDLGLFQLECISAPYFSFYRGHAKFKYDVLLQTPDTFKKRQFIIALLTSGRDHATFDDDQEVAVSGGNGSFNFNPRVNEEHLFYKDVPTAVTSIEIQPDYFIQLLMEQDDDQGQLSSLKQSVFSERFVHFPAILSTAHQRIISDIESCPLQGSLGNLMLEGSLQQLIALQLFQLHSPKRAQETISARDREILYAVKEYLTIHFHLDHSLMTLCRKFAINQTKLKKYFKSLFGIPVIEYVFDRKMEHARKLLYDKQMYVGEVARITGYKNPQHFATAFKRKYGISPTSIKKYSKLDKRE
jgi:AraC-like DNA-binding protein